MFAEIIAIGTELTTGAKLDTNSQWLSLELAKEGIEVLFHTTVADSIEANVQAFQNAIERVDLVIITGGLGPTLDDLTRQVIADLLKVSLVLDEPSLKIIEGMFARRKREMPERNRIQAMFPEGSEIIPNPRGTAPGIWHEIPRESGGTTYLAALPGVPSEMKGMFLEWVIPRLQKLSGGGSGKFILSHRINCFGSGESHAEELLGDLTSRGRDPEVGITVHEGTITLRIEAHGESRAECERKIAATSELARERLGALVFGVEEEELEDVLSLMLGKRAETLSTLEIGTGGHLGQVLGHTANFSAVYRGGLILSSTVLGKEVLSFASENADISSLESTARELRSRLGTDYTLVVGEFPPDDPATDEVPTTEVGLLAGEDYLTRKIHLGGDPAILRSRIAKGGMNLLRLFLMGELKEKPENRG